MTEEQAEYNVGKKKESMKPGAPEGKTCFVIAPIGEPGSKIRRNTDGLYDGVIGPSLRSVESELNIKFKEEIAHRISAPGSITGQVIKHLIYDDLVICDLTSLNPNVMYELAVRHAKRKPVITLYDEETDLPFDVKDERSIRYRNDFQGLIELKVELKKTIKLAINQKSNDIDNPIYRVIREFVLESIEITDPQREMINMIKAVLNRIDSLAPFEPTPEHQIFTAIFSRDLEVFEADEFRAAIREKDPNSRFSVNGPIISVVCVGIAPSWLKQRFDNYFRDLELMEFYF